MRSKTLPHFFLFSFILLSLCFTSNVHSQNVGINTATPDASAVLEVQGTNGGMLTPRMTEAQRDAIAGPAAGLLIFQTDEEEGFWYYSGTEWLPLGGMGCKVPREVEVFPLNRASTHCTEEGLELMLHNSTRLNAEGNLPPAGTFEGDGRGNRIFVGVNAFHNLPLASLTEFSVTAKTMIFPTQPVEPLFINLVVDANADGIWNPADGDAILISTSRSTPDLALDGTMRKIDIDVTGTVWQAVGGVAGLPSHTVNCGTSCGTLADFLATYPDAVVANLRTTDGGMPFNTIMPGVLLSCGSSGNFNSIRVRLQEVTVNNQRFIFAR